MLKVTHSLHANDCNCFFCFLVFWQLLSFQYTYIYIYMYKRANYVVAMQIVNYWLFFSHHVMLIPASHEKIENKTRNCNFKRFHKTWLTMTPFWITAVTANTEVRQICEFHLWQLELLFWTSWGNVDNWTRLWRGKEYHNGLWEQGDWIQLWSRLNQVKLN